MALILRNGEVITASDRYKADVRIEGGKITQIGLSLPVGEGDESYDCAGRWIVPGGIDVHTHLDMPFMGTTSSDDFYTGTRAASAGGTTSIIDFVIPRRGQSLLNAYDDWRGRADGKAVFDYAFHMAVTWFDTAEVRSEFSRCIDNGMTSFKTFMAYTGALGIDDDELFKVMSAAKDHGAMVTVHAENGDAVNNLIARHLGQKKVDPIWHARSRPPEVEGEATWRAITLARFNGQPLYVVHLTCRDALERVREARARGQVVYAETCPQYLVFDESVYERPDFDGAKWVMSPPIRPKGHPDALWDGIAEGLIQTVATDHCPFFFKGQKEMGRDNFSKIPNGAPGIQDRMSVMYHYGVRSGKLTPHQWIDVCCTQPARIFGLFPQKGTIAVGTDADVVVFDPGHEFIFRAADSQHRCDYNLYEGMSGSGRCELVLSRGRVLWEKGEFKGNSGMGDYLSRSIAKDQQAAV